MKTYLIVGSQGRGKTDFVVQRLKMFKYIKGTDILRDNYVFDPKGGYNNKGINNKATKAKTKEDFLSFVPTKYPSNKNVVFEDASGYLGKSGTPPTAVTDHVCTVFHTKNLNFFMYHALSIFNMDMLPFIDYIILFRTQGDRAKVYKKFSTEPNIIAAYEKVQMLTENTFFDRATKKYGNGTKESEARSRKWYHHYEVVTMSS